jgi:hypothetical protein
MWAEQDVERDTHIISGELISTDGDYYFIKDERGKEVSLLSDQRAVKPVIEKEDRITAYVDDDNYALCDDKNGSDPMLQDTSRFAPRRALGEERIYPKRQFNNTGKVVSRFNAFALPHQHPCPRIDAHEQLMKTKEQDGPFTHQAPHQIADEEDRDSTEASENRTNLILFQRIGGHDRQYPGSGDEAGSGKIDHFNQLRGH